MKIYISSLFLLLITFSAWVGAPAFCQTQTDSVKTEYSEEKPEKSDFTFKEKYRYFTRASVEEKTLIKIGASLGGGYGGYYGFLGRFINTVSVERKLIPSVSLMLEVENRWITNGKLHNGYSFGLNPEVRFYYAINKRMREGKTANNFSNRYLSLKSYNYLYQRNADVFAGETIAGYNHSLSLLWGKQIRLGRYGYFDAGIGPNVKLGPLRQGYNRLGLDVKLSLGLGF